MIIKILVPVGRVARAVNADGAEATKVSSHKYPGFDWSVEEWDAPDLVYEPGIVKIAFDPM